MSVVCIDPGVRTGYCIADESGICEVGVVKTLAAVYRLLTLSAERVVVIEQFNRGQQLAESHIYTVKVIGVVELFVEQHPNIELVYQTPFERKAYIEKARRIAARYVCAVDDRPHIVDAVAHWLAFQNKRSLRR